MTFEELQQFDIDVNIYNKNEFAVVATLQNSSKITIIQRKDEEYGDVDYDVYRIKSVDVNRIAEGDMITIDSKQREILTIEPIEMSQGLEYWITLKSESIK